tara:strand:+ start:1886 stop:2092 length:207 start_codon:yes stop_codon:yes gene_type:complete
MITKLNDKKYLQDKIEETFDEADMIAELICEGGAEGAYTPRELSKMQYKVHHLESLASVLETRLSKLN